MTALVLGAGQRLALDSDAPLLMGIVNTSPESFSDGGLLPDADAQVAQALSLVAEGAALVDVGGESGVTNRPPVPPGEEIRRVIPVVERLAAAGVAVSVDTWKASVARAALAAGAAMVNDPSGLCDPALATACAEHGAALVVTHTRAAPKVKSFPPYEKDIMAEVIAFLGSRVRVAERLGIATESIFVDPGLDLAKTPAQSVELLRRLGELHELGRPILLAASRKDFVGALTGRPPAGRLAGALAALDFGASAAAAILRVHEVAPAADFLAVRCALRGARPIDPGLELEERLRREPARLDVA